MSNNALNKLNFVGTDKLPLIRQNEAAECGNACLAMIASFYGYKTDIASLRRRFPATVRGMTLRTLVEIANKVGFATRAIKVELEHLTEVRLPAIIHWDMNHFVVLKSVSANKAVIHDPAQGVVEYSTKELSQHFTGIALELEPTSSFEKRDEKAKLRLSSLWSSLRGLSSSIVQVLLLSIVLQLFVLASPFYLQITVDEVLPGFDFDLLLVLAIGFGIFNVINVLAQVIRGYVILYAGSSLGYQIVLNLFSHLVRLPLPFFEKRHIGDIVSRFSSATPIKDFLTEGVTAALVDGLMAIVTLVLMFIYSPMLAGIVVAAFLIYAALRFALYRPLRQCSEHAIVSQAKEQTNFIETVRGIMSIKLFAHEGERQQKWQNLFADSINQQVKVEKLRIWFLAGNTLISGIEHVILIFLAARMVMNAEFSIGMIFAFMAYRQQFVTKSTILIELAIEFKILDLHLERISDIAFEDQEDKQNIPTEDTVIDGHIDVQCISYSYEEDAPNVLNEVSFTANSGETVAITGISGCGKTTLVKIMLGLFSPKSGEILVDGKNIKHIGLSNYRRQVAAVMQDDELFAGSIADNIAFFDSEIEMHRVVECADKACIHNDIAQMPMSYETHIGDMGAALSGGQKQRVLLARALYQNPKILFMDEGTAHLDLDTEKQVNSLIQQLGITRIIIAHRPETIKLADRILRMQNGQLVETGIFND